MFDINAQAADIHSRNYKWWHTEDGVRLVRNKGEMLMLVVSEISEAMEALRKDLMDDKLSHRKGEEVELADAYIRLLDFAAGHGIELRMTGEGHLVRFDNRAENLLDIVESVTSAHEASRIEERMHIEDALDLIIGYCAEQGYDLQGAVTEKLAYNDTRKDHTWEARKAEGGKAF